MSTDLTQADLIGLWERHTELEFATKDAVATVATMTSNNYVNHVPVMTGGRGKDEMIEFYGRHFIPTMPADTALRLLSRTVGNDRVIDEFVFSFTHDVVMDWMLPGSSRPTEKWKSRWWSSCSSRGTRSRANASIGIKRRFSFRSAHWIEPRLPIRWSVKNGCELRKRYPTPIWVQHAKSPLSIKGGEGSADA